MNVELKGMIYTGYFSKIEQYKKIGLNCIAISRTIPKWVYDKYNIRRILNMAPTDKMLYSTPKLSNSEFIDTYNKEILSNLDVHYFAERYQDCILLCWESPNKFCHRQLVAQWFMTNGYNCVEKIIR